MASPTIQFKRGLIANLPALRAGEPGFTTDTTDLYVGGSDGNKYFGSHRYWGKEDGSTALRLKMVDKNGSNNISLKAPDTLAGVTTYTLPATPTNGYFLKTDEVGTLSWASVTTTLEGAQINNATLTGLTTVTNVDVQGGVINGTTIGLTTAAAGAFTTLSADSLNVTGIATVGSLSIGSTEVVSSAFQLQNILSLDATTTATIEAAVANAPNTFADLQVTGISTFQGEVNIGDSSADVLTVNSTATFLEPVVGTISTATALENAQNFSITGDFVTAAAISFDGTGAVAFAATITANSIELGTYTSGDYVAGATGTANEVEVSGTGEGASLVIGLPNEVVVGTSLTAPTVYTGAVSAQDGTAAITVASATGAVGVSSDLTVSGNLYVNGTTTQVNTTSLTVEDTLVELGMVDGAVPASDLNKDLGLVLNYFDTSAKKAAVYWDDSVTRFALASEVSEASSVLTAAAYAALEVSGLYVNNACSGGVQEVIGCANGELNLMNIVVDGGLFA